MEKLKNYDIFLTHAWRFHDDWKRFSELLDGTANVAWRNFSLPWHDPAMNPNSEVGGRFIRDFLESQIIPVHSVVLLSGVYKINSARRWFDMEVEMARKHNKPLIGIPGLGEDSVPDEVAILCDECCGWDALQLLATIDRVRELPKYL
ncbi:TIR domain-containing protein [Methylomonas rivi]|uniref:TIR domain-containing protein n=1 Tax=Methylomonas rivi TaxID=2952226 RepID=A0ABT1U0Q5_9GAMM|nr:TIR domain-containing protein [Methylomonas sp. WSC-6]MBS4051853.1 TIR domain-containing protein [Methylomonas sp.]MCQ8127405.1 TIR domain-containing protein [Methylomonas sp. WSC-6]